MDKAVYVRDLFATIAPRYDATNRILTGGIDEFWRRRAVRELAAPARGRIIDLCCGTGDLSFHLVRSDKSLSITGVDFCEPMLEGARKRATHEDRNQRVAFRTADVSNLPFANATFDGAIMGFSMRNVAEIAVTLREIRRILKPGARFVNLDISKAPNPLFRSVFTLYFYRVVPLVGGIIGGSPSAYRYLPDSLTNHPDADGLADRFSAAGFREARYIRLAGGAIAVHSGIA